MAASLSPRPIRTPCVKVCFIDDASGLCLGCFRTLVEVATWSRLDEAARDAVIAELPARRSLIAPEKLGRTD
jgi:predicted Fe-S protein YdhL (DUF1289 family)